MSHISTPAFDVSVISRKPEVHPIILVVNTFQPI